MEVLYERCCGLDVHAATVVACVRRPAPRGRRSSEVRTFGTTTGELRKLAEWLTAEGVTHVAMESTGVFWKPVFNILEGSSGRLILSPVKENFMRLLVLATTVLSVFIGLGSHTPALAFNPDLPLLSDISVTEPDKSMPKEFSHFSGWWYGGWFGSKTNTHMSDHILIVETIAPPTATVVYSWRAKPRWGGREVVLRLGGKFENEELVITFENGSQARYRPRGDDELSGTYQDSKQGRFTSILKKISPIK